MYQYAEPRFRGSAPRTMRKKLVPLIAIAFVVAVFSTAVFYALFAGRLSGASTPALVSGARIVVATRDLGAGTVLSRGDLNAVAWAGETLPKGSYDAVDKVEGKTAFNAILQGEPVLESRLAARDGTGSGVPEGMRAVSVHVSDSSGVVGLLKPGYKVDVQEFASRSTRGPKDEVRTLLRGVTVLAINAQPEQSSQGYFSAPVVTLLASARDAGELAQSDSYSRLRLALRNPLEKEPAAEPSAVAPAVPHVPTALFRVRTVALTDEGLAVLASRVDPRIGANRINVIVADTQSSDIASLVESGLARAGSESRIQAAPRQWSTVDLQVEGPAKVRLQLAATGTSDRLRVRPEVTGVWGGRLETRSVETEAEAGRAILVSGLDRGENAKPDPRFRHLLVMVLPETGRVKSGD